MDPKQALQSFIETSIKAGQKKEDIMRILTGRGWDAESVNRVYDFVVNVSGSMAANPPTEQKPPSTKTPSTPSSGPKEPFISVRLMLISFVVVLVVGLIIAFIVAFIQKANPRAELPATLTDKPSPQPLMGNVDGQTRTPTSTVTDPMLAFADSFRAGDFRIKGSGILSREEKTSSMSSSTSLDFNKTVFYSKRGSILRIDVKDTKQNAAYIVKGQQLLTLNLTSKTYSQESLTSDFGIFFKSLIDSSFIPSLMQKEEKKLTWKRQTDRIWETDYAVSSPLDTSPIQSHVTLTLNAENLVTQMDFIVKGTVTKQTVTFAYEKLADIDTYLSIPSGYREETIPG